MLYPKLKKVYSRSELYEFFQITSDELQFINQVRPRKDKNLLGFLILLKCYLILGYPPRQTTDISEKVIDWIAHQIDRSPSLFKEYDWKSRVWERHLALIREFTGFRACNFDDLQELSRWLIEQRGRLDSSKELFIAAIQKCRASRLELPSENELRRLVNSSRQRFFDQFYQNVWRKIDPRTLELMNQCLESFDGEMSRYDWMKSSPGSLKLKTILDEIKKLNFIKEFKVKKDSFSNLSQDILHEFRDRARAEDSYQMQRHPIKVRYTFLTIILYFRQSEVTDHIVKLFLDLIRRIEKKAKKSLENQLVRNIKKVYGKQRILYKIARAATSNPDNTVREVIFKGVSEETLNRIVNEFELEKQEADYEISWAKAMKRKYSFHYRKMLKPILETLVFFVNNPAHQPILDGLRPMRKYLNTKHPLYPEYEQVPDSFFTGQWEDVVFQETKNGRRIVRYYFELCVLQKLAKALKCKEIWVEGAYLYRNPDLDLPQDWHENRLEYFEKLKIPTIAENFIEPIRKEMAYSLKEANEFFAQKQDV
jgi:hypothetical protein